MEYVEPRTRKDREAAIIGLTAAYQHRDLGAFEARVRSDVVMTLSGSSRLAGTHRGYEAFERLLELLREVLAAAGRPIKFEHASDEMVCWHAAIVSGPQHDVQMLLVVTVRYDTDGLVESVVVEPGDQALFDYVVDSSATSMSS